MNAVYLTIADGYNAATDAVGSTTKHSTFNEAHAHAESLILDNNVRTVYIASVMATISRSTKMTSVLGTTEAA